jgi:hypothetical protein
LSPRLKAFGQVTLVALVVGGLFLSFSVYQINTRYGGHPSGPLLISHDRFVASPASVRADVRSGLRVIDGPGSDGQFFYFMTFDPFMTTWRQTPDRYAEYLDAPPYRYGRIGFSLLTGLVSLNHPTRYPVIMVTLVIIGLALSAAWLGAIAQQRGLSPWYGALILLVPGFWRAAEGVLPEPLAIASILAAYWCIRREQWWTAGLLLGASMLIRETSGALVLALAGGLLITGKHRPGLIVTALAFVPIVAWKIFVAWVFWARSGLHGLLPTPNDSGLPFAGMWHLWTVLARGEYSPGVWEMTRGAMVFPIVILAAIGLAVWAAARQRTAAAMAALFYAALTITFNYEAVWIHLAPIERLTIDLFVALALVFVELGRDARAQRAAFALFWGVTAWYVGFMTFEASQIRESVFRNIVGQ